MKWYISLVSICLSVIALGQRQLSATKCEEIILIDGKLDESVWKSSSVADSFIQRRPFPGEQSSQFTQAMVAYDDFNLYVAARCFDDPEKISRVLSQRDDLNANIDNFQIILDTYNDDLNAFIFGVSSAGVQYDAKVYADNENVELNMAWESHVHFTEKGWQLEMKIPYSAFRFPKKDEQSWGVNFYRYISRNREESYWNAVKPDFDNAVAQCGNLLNINGIEPPLRLAFMPYISGYADRGADPSDPTSWTRSVNGGMDIKLGLNEAFTLDMTLVPDFGQVVYDNKVLNISPFELQFNENRQFFTEGTELFNKSGLFYSRRIGVQQSNSVLFSNLESNEQLLSVDDSPQLYNATKVSGRTKTGLGIGVFNGITAPQQGTAFNDSTGLARSLIVAPLTNYNVLVLDQNLKNNSSVTLTNTNVLREGSFYDANVSGLDFKINTKDNSYFISGKGTLSSKMYSSSSVLGYNAGMSLGKQTGNVIYKLNYFEESNTYDPNDLGFNTNNNKRNTEASIGYRQFKPFWKFIQASGNATLSYQRLYSPDVYTFTNLNGNIFGLIKGFHATGIRLDASLTKGYDYFEPRTVGRYFLTPTWFSTSYWFSSNYQKKFALDFGLTYGDVGMQDWREYTYNISPRFRFSDRLFLVYSWEQELSLSSRGYAVAFGTPVEIHSGILFGKRNRNSVTNTINITYTLTNRMGITWRIRHYRSSLRYMDFFDLSADGTLNDINYSGNDSDGNSVYNINYNAFTVDFVYRWVFRPGSELNIVWKNAIFNSDQNFNLTYSENLEALFEKAALNSFSMKLIYWIDYQDFRNKTRSQS
ncbi:MAG: carbohydrate binding family 9 domain-containing protein [Cryomorphaceae bacterium]|nr:carbohydrate binding family 9 domain-containing protein [Cryomorphaceae bacterium]